MNQKNSLQSKSSEQTMKREGREQLVEKEKSPSRLMIEEEKGKASSVSLDPLEKIEDDEEKIEPKPRRPTPQNIYLCGKNISSAFLTEIQSKLHLKPVILKTNIARVPEGRESELAILLSLAKKKVAPPEDEKSINILPQPLVTTYKLIAQKKLENTLFLFGCLLLLIFGGLNFYTLFQINQEKRKLSIQVASFEKIGASLPSAFFTQKITLLVRLDKENKTLKKATEEIIEKKSDEIELSGINYNQAKGEMILSGRAKTREGLLKFRDDLGKSELLQKAVVPLSSLAREEDIEFRMNIELVGLKQTISPTISLEKKQ